MGKKNFEFARWPFELPANQHSQFGPSGRNWLCWLAGSSKGHRANSKFYTFSGFFYYFGGLENEIWNDSFFLHLKLKSHNMGRILGKKIQICVEQVFKSKYNSCLPPMSIHKAKAKKNVADKILMITLSSNQDLCLGFQIFDLL